MLSSNSPNRSPASGVPPTVNGSITAGMPEAGDLFGLFDDTVRRLLKGLN